MMARKNEIEHYATFIHGVLFGLHSLGLYHNVRKRKWLYAGVHLFALGFSFVSAVKHLRPAADLCDGEPTFI